MTFQSLSKIKIPTTNSKLRYNSVDRNIKQMMDHIQQNGLSYCLSFRCLSRFEGTIKADDQYTYCEIRKIYCEAQYWDKLYANAENKLPNWY